MSSTGDETRTAATPTAATATVEHESLLDQILQETRYAPDQEGYDVARQGVAAFIAELLKPSQADAKVQAGLVDQMIAEIDGKLSDQVDSILHSNEVKELESAWRGLKFLVDRTDFRQNIRIELLNVSKDALIEDFEDAPEVEQSGLYKHIYTDEYGVFGGQPIGSVIANFEFGSGSQDVQLLHNASSVGAMAHAPFIAAASPKMFGVDRHEDIAGLKDLESIFEGPQYARWNAFRESEDARYVGLTVSRFMLREPYGEESNPIKEFNYNEESDGEAANYLWGNSAFAFASRLSDSFAKYRWCPNVIGPQSGGAVENLPVHRFQSMGKNETKAPTDVMISDRREYELAEQGFIALVNRKNANNATFFSANSIQKPKYFGNTPEGKAAETNYKLGTQLPYMFVINRLAHYVKVLQRENIGSWKDRGELESELNGWIRQYVSDQENPSAEVRNRRPLRRAEIKVEDVEGEPGWYSVSMAVQPHFKYMGADFTLSLKGKLDKS